MQRFTWPILGFKVYTYPDKLCMKKTLYPMELGGFKITIYTLLTTLYYLLASSSSLFACLFFLFSNQSCLNEFITVSLKYVRKHAKYVSCIRRTTRIKDKMFNIREN